MPFRTLSLLAAALFVLGGCRTRPAHTVILVSVDGFRADYVDLFELPTFQRLAGEGAWADEGMLPLFPTKTFPNHYSIATGLYPARHGIIANTMYDPALDRYFRISDREAVEDTAWWGGEPIWVTAEKQGVTAANFFWVGSEAPVKGVQSTIWKRYDYSVSGEARVDSVLSWLDLEAERRPRFITLYFEVLDQEAHRDGPESQAARQAALDVDRHLERLLDGVARRGLGGDTDVIVVSDHGMTDLSPDRVVFLEDYVDVSIGDILEYFPVLFWNPGADHVPSVRAALEGAPHLTVLDADTLASRYGFSGNDRIPQVVAMADEGWIITSTRAYFEPRRDRFSLGMHGYAPELASQRALFVASGPSFRPGSRIAPFENVHVYPLLAHLLGIEPAPNDGSLETLRPLLR